MALPRRLRPLLAAIAGGAIFAGCGSGNDGLEIPGPNSKLCTPGVAVVGIQDGEAGVVCGCNEAPSWTAAPASVTCTVAANTVVLFEYVGTTLLHQVIPNGTPSFTASQLSNPADQNPFRLHTVVFSTSGTYKFIDNFNHALSGQIIVL